VSADRRFAGYVLDTDCPIFPTTVYTSAVVPVSDIPCMIKIAKLSWLMSMLSNGGYIFNGKENKPSSLGYC
jgi:hypothetical protein